MFISRFTGNATHTPEQQKFHEAMLSHGGRLPWELLPPSAKALPAIYQVAQGLISRAHTVYPKLPRIHFNFINSNEINGIACKRNGEYFIGITGGTVTLLQVVLHRMLSDPELFPSIGNPKAEESNPPLIKFLPDARKLHEAATIVTIPKDEARFNYSCRLINLVVMFLVGHEIAHITRGHVDYLAALTGSHFLPELRWTNSTPFAPIERQAMECEADQYSFNGLLGSAFAQSNATETSATSDQLALLCRLVLEYSFSANIIFRLFGDERFVGSDLTAESYPPFAVRRMIMDGGGREVAIRTLVAERQEMVIQALGAGMVGAEHAFGRVVGESVSMLGLSDAFGQEGREHYKMLTEYSVNELAPKLKPFAYESERSATS